MEKLPLFCMAILFVVVTVNSADRPGLQIQVQQSALNKAAQVAIDQLAVKLNNKRLSDVSGKSGRVSYSLSSVVITSFRKPSSLVTVRPSPGLTWSASGAAFEVHGNWRYEYKRGWIRIRDSGNFRISMSGISFSISAKAGKDSSGRPTLYSTACSRSIQHASVRIGGSSFSWLYNLFRGTISRRLKGAAENEMCKAARSEIDDDLKRELLDVEVMSTLRDNMVLDYRLVVPPVFGNGFLQTKHKGEFRSRSSPQPFTTQPAPFPSAGSTSRMVYVWGSDYTINSFAFTAFSKGMAQYNITENDLPPDAKEYLTTSCTFPDICLGSLLPEAAEKHPNSKALINIKATRAPFVTTTPKGINLTLPGQISLRLQAPDGKQLHIIKISLVVNISLNVWLNDVTLYGKVVDLSSDVTSVESVLGEIPPDALETLFDRFVKPVVTKKLNELGQKGISIPHLRKAHLTRPVLVLNTGGLMVAADVELKGIQI